jgi:hypothetical protein
LAKNRRRSPIYKAVGQDFSANLRDRRRIVSLPGRGRFMVGSGGGDQLIEQRRPPAPR